MHASYNNKEKYRKCNNDDAMCACDLWVAAFCGTMEGEVGKK